MLLFINTSVFPNDSRIVLGSSVEIINNENTNITMLEEEIIITLYNRYYEVDVSFDFYNDGDDEDVLLGFPVWTVTYDNPEEIEWAKIENFQSFINGELVTEYDTIKESTKDLQLYTTTWFVREVTFPENSHTYSRVTYRAPYNSLGFKSGAGYIYGTGRNWKGSIGKMTVKIVHEDDTLIEEVSFGRNRAFDELIWEASGIYRFIFNDIDPDEGERIEILVRHRSIFHVYQGQFGLSWDGEWIWNRRLLEEFSNTNLYTRNQLKLFISFFYAMHGYDFENQLLKNYFQNMPPSWYNENLNYKADPNFSENNFNGFERKNIDYLSSLERSIASDDDPASFDNFLEKLNASVELEMASDKQKEDEVNDPENTGEKQPDKSGILALMKTNLFIRYLIFIVLHITIALTTIICVFTVIKIRKKRSNAGAK
jgi:hypothetical protein